MVETSPNQEFVSRSHLFSLYPVRRFLSESKLRYRFAQVEASPETIHQTGLRFDTSPMNTEHLSRVLQENGFRFAASMRLPKMPEAITFVKDHRDENFVARTSISVLPDGVYILTIEN